MNTKSTKRASLLRTLRALVPERPLTASGAYKTVERQAAVLRRTLGILSPEFPEEAISLVPRVRVIEIDNLPTSGVSTWHNGYWVIVVNGNEPWQRQRFTTAHELGHFVAHGTENQLLAHAADPGVRREQLADYFAGCLLMPAVHIRRLVTQGYEITDLADLFGVSTRAVEVRLSQLERRTRCNRAVTASGLQKEWKYVCPPPDTEEVAA